MAYVLDGLAILIVAFCIWRGWHRGLVRTAVLLIGFVLAAFLAGKVASPLAQATYNGVIAPRVEQLIVEEIRKEPAPQMAVGLDMLFEDVSYFENMGWPTSVTVDFTEFTDTAIEQAVRPAIAQVIGPVLIHLLTALLSLLLFVLLMIVVALIARVLDRVCRLPLLKQLNGVGGLAFGALQGVFWALLFSISVELLAGYGVFGTVVTAKAIETTGLVSLLAGWNWIF